MIPDLIAARRSARAYAKYALRKTVFTDKLFVEHGAQVSARTQFVYNAQTDVCNPSCALYYFGEMFYPTKQHMRDALPTIQSTVRHYQRRDMIITLPKKHERWGEFSVGRIVEISLRKCPKIKIRAAIRSTGGYKHVVLPAGHLPKFISGDSVSVLLLKEGAKMETELIFRGQYDNDVSIMYANIIDSDGNDAGTLSADAETWQDGDNIRWTGNIEVSFRASDSEEFDVISVEQADIKPSQKAANRLKAEAAIKRCLCDANELETSSRGTS